MADGGIDTRTAHVSAEEALAMHARAAQESWKFE